MNLIYKNQPSISIEQLFQLYNDAQWTSYTNNMELLKNAILNSLDVYTAWDGEELVGLIRTIGDQYSIIYIQDILVLKEYQRIKIGSQLLRYILDKYNSIRQIILLTNDTPQTRRFYESMGLESYDKGKLVAFGKI